MMKRSLNNKVTGILVLAISSIMLILLLVNLVGVWKMRFDTIGQRQKQDAQIFSDFIAQQIEEEVNGIIVHLNNPWLIDAAKEVNQRYANWKPEAIKEYMMRVDEQWIPAATDSQFIQRCLSSRLSQWLKVLAKVDTSIGEIFLTDKYGGLVAASDKTSDFYQADEIWWQRAYNNGKGDIYFGEMELDESSGTISSAIAIPLKDDTGQIIGVSKTILDLSVFFKPLSKYEFGKTGHVSLLDNQGNVIYHFGLKPMSKSGFSGFVLERILRIKKGFETIAAPCLKVKSIVSVTKVNSPFFEANGINWMIVVTQAENEVFIPIYIIFVEELALTIIVLFLLIFVMRNTMLSMFIAPLEKIREGVVRFGGGDLDYSIDIKTADEFELLAESLNEMSARLKQTMVTRDRLEESIKELSKSRDILISMLDENNVSRMRLEESLKEEKNTQIQLIQSEKLDAIGRMALGIAHEVKNPLAIILQGINYFEGALPLENKNNCEILAMMKNGLRRADNIVRALLDFSRFGELKEEQRDVNAVIETAVNLVQHKFKLNSIECVYELGRDLPKTLMDKEKMEQVLINLFNNAMDAMPKGGKLYVRSYLLKEGAVVVEVEDTGLGINEGTIDKIFNPFFTTKNRTEGTGLGLSVAKSIIEMHKALISVESKKGIGTKFTIVFKIP